jgi:hypothetical protein
MKQPKQKPCKVCKKPFLPATSLHSVCSWQCSIKLAEKMRLEREKRETRERNLRIRAVKLKLKPLKEYLDDAQIVVNKYIRLRDAHLPCISCGTVNPNIQYCAGHFRTRKAAPHLRFNEDNIHKQCNNYCNSKLSGNIINYRPRLIEKIGIERVEALENNNELHRFTIEEALAIKAEYKAKIKEML